MKKSLLVFCLAAGIYACGGGTTEVETKPISNNEESKNGQIGGEAPKAEASAAPAAAPVAEAAAPAPGKDGKALIAGSDCLACHKEKEKMVGPAYADVAKKYENNAKNVKMLVEKIIAGGQGNWGEIPMAAHPNVTPEDAEAMVNYILSIK